MPKIRPMTETEFESWKVISKKNYAADKMRANNLTLEEAIAISEKSFNEHLSQGLKTPNHYLYVLENDQKILGHFWVRILKSKAFIFDVGIKEEFQGKGFGREIMKLGEEKAKELGATSIGLHVFGFNDRAIKLYQSLNYQTTDLAMEKKL